MNSARASALGPTFDVWPVSPIVERDVRSRAAVDHVGILRIRRGDAVLLNVDRMPIVERDLAVHRPAVDARRAGVLLSAADAIGERVVRRDVIHRRRRLRVPIAPRRAAVRRDDAALIGDDEKNVRIVGIDPRLLVVVAARCAAHRGPRLSAVFRSPKHRRRAVHDVLVLRIDRERRQIAAADASEWARIRAAASTATPAAGRRCLRAWRPLSNASRQCSPASVDL